MHNWVLFCERHPTHGIMIFLRVINIVGNNLPGFLSILFRSKLNMQACARLIKASFGFCMRYYPSTAAGHISVNWCFTLISRKRFKLAQPWFLSFSESLSAHVQREVDLLVMSFSSFSMFGQVGVCGCVCFVLKERLDGGCHELSPV